MRCGPLSSLHNNVPQSVDGKPSPHPPRVHLASKLLAQRLLVVREILVRGHDVGALARRYQRHGVIAELGQVLELVLLVAHLLAHRTLLEQRDDLALRQLARVVDEVLLGQKLPFLQKTPHHGKKRGYRGPPRIRLLELETTPQTKSTPSPDGRVRRGPRGVGGHLQQDERGELGDGEAAEDGPHVPRPLLLLRLVVLGQVAVGHVAVVVVSHVVVLAEAVVLSLDDQSTVDAGDVLVLGTELDEAMQGKVHKGKEKSHAEERLEVDKPHKPGDLSHATVPREDKDGDDECRHRDPVPEHAAPENVVVFSKNAAPVLPENLESAQASCSDHVVENAEEEEEEVVEGGTVQIELVESVAFPPVQVMMQKHMRCGEAVWHVAIPASHPVFPEISKDICKPGLVNSTIAMMPFLVRESVRASHSSSTQSNPLEIIKDY
mmetsp:Transcript_60381/g.160850  ORF Transcript_60381/g.160850 Transcript_60381/m.160850 type:complete len:435 (-) Transcript_60381:620-1924(-)